jgi:hypothetical protein
MEDSDKNTNEILLKAILSLSDWSKWLISVHFAAATGCVLVLKGAPTERVKPMLLFAIIFFSLSLLCASLFVFLLSSQVEKVAETKRIKYKQLGTIQLALFGVGLDDIRFFFETMLRHAGTTISSISDATTRGGALRMLAIRSPPRRLLKYWPVCRC